LDGGADIAHQSNPDTLVANLRRSRDRARANTAPPEEKSPMLYWGNMR